MDIWNERDLVNGRYTHYLVSHIRVGKMETDDSDL